MLRATIDLLDRFRKRPDSHRVRALLSFIEDYGDEEDAEALLDLYLNHPEAYELLSPIRKLGSTETAERLFNRCMENRRVKAKFLGDVFTSLAYMGYQPVEEVLYQCLLKEEPLGSDECVALLHFSCADYEAAIREKILKYKNQNLFPEFHPLLASKVPDPDLPDLLYHWGTHWASVDCNGGLVLGLALYGEPERERFKQILWDDRWEAHGSATGTIRWTYIGMQYLGITFRELFREIQAAAKKGVDEEAIRYHLFVLKDLLELRIHWTDLPLRFASPLGTCEEIYQTLFDWSENRDDNIIDWVSDNVENREYLDLYQTKELLCMKMEQEMRKEFALRELG